MNKNFFFAIASLIGMIIGVGIFGIPYVVVQAGLLAGFFYLLLLAVMITIVHLSYGEIALRTNAEHGLVGYAEKYLGRTGKKIMGGTIIFEFYGALLAYLIAGGHFLNIIFSKFFGNITFINFSANGDFIWTIIFFILGSFLVFRGLKAVAPSEFFMAIILVAIACIFIFRGVPFFRLDNLSVLNWAKVFMPYGVILFSLTGGAAIPEIRQLLKGQESRMKKVIIWGTIIPAIIYLLFTTSVVGVSGSNTSKDAMSGLVPYFGSWIVILGAFFGFLAVTTSYLMISTNLRRIFHKDYKINNLLSWFLVCFFPLAIFISGINDFIMVIGIVGALAMGMEGIMVILIHRRAKKIGERQPEYRLKISRPILYGLILVYLFGIIYQFIYLF